MALCRIKTIEQLQYESPGELGKLTAARARLSHLAAAKKAS